MGHVVLLTGATGMVGQALVPVLAARTDVSQIFAVGHKAAVPVRHKKVVSISGNVRAGPCMAITDDVKGQIQDRVSVIIHAAAAPALTDSDHRSARHDGAPPIGR